MAVITELIDAGLRLKRGGNLGGAIEHFKQLHATYPGHARIMFELAACWRAFGVPEQALPLYRELKAMPKGTSLPPKDIPRLYTQLGATLLDMGDHSEALAILEEGLRLHPSYRSLRAWRIFALAKAGSHATALLDALELMLESLAPSRWDIFEADIKAMVRAMRDQLPEEATAVAALPIHDSSPAAIGAESAAELDGAEIVEGEKESGNDGPRDKIHVTSDASQARETEVKVNLVEPEKKTSPKKGSSAQMGKKAARIEISDGRAEAPESMADGDESAPADGSFKIPIDLD